jgi:hypothetical protein
MRSGPLNFFSFSRMERRAWDERSQVARRCQQWRRDGGQSNSRTRAQVRMKMRRTYAET